MHTLFIALTPVGILAIFMPFIYLTLTNKKHKLLCDEFYNKFGYIPDDIASYERGGIFFTFQRDICFFLSLLFKPNSFFVRNINRNLYNFIRELPKHKISWIKIKFNILLFGILILIIDHTIFTLFIKDGY